MTGDKLGFHPKDDHGLFEGLFNRASLLKCRVNDNFIAVSHQEPSSSDIVLFLNIHDVTNSVVISQTERRPFHHPTVIFCAHNGISLQTSNRFLIGSMTGSKYLFSNGTCSLTQRANAESLWNESKMSTTY